MEIKKEFESTVESVKIVLSSWKHKIISLLFAVAVFSFLYYFLVANVAGNDIWISVMMSGPRYITFSVVSILLTSVFSGILFSMIIFKFNSYRKIEGKGLLGFIGSGVAALGIGCPTCGAFLFGFIGMPLALMYLPFRGLELQTLGILVLILSIYFTGKSIKEVCKISKY